ncbi:MAG: hypothetical protein NZZ41_01085 [Candidatus Dojkabacteria bacterium]|nr:hypothetical protein [Candidatus Dojkabacteria bacterium]
MPQGESSNVLYIPSLEACYQCGIERIGAPKLNPQRKLSFLNGPQFENFNKPEKEDKPLCMDEVVINFIGNNPTVLKPVTGEDNIIRMEYDLLTLKRLNDPIFTIKVIPKQRDWLNFAFSHRWEEGNGIVGQVLEKIADVVDSFSGVLNAARNVTNYDKPSALKKVTLDKQDQFQESEKISFEIPFILFTIGKPLNENDNFVKRWVHDIYKPLILLTTWTFPKRFTGIIETKDKKNIDTSNPGSVQQLTESAEFREKAKDEDNLQESILRFLSSYPGVRVAISEPPSYVSIKHTSGFFQFDICVINKVSYKFCGPWVKASTMFKDSNSMYGVERELLDLSLPLVVEGSISIKVIEKLYADDWISMFENSPILRLAGETGNEILNITKNRYKYEGDKMND